jgi:hypothetical protein
VASTKAAATNVANQNNANKPQAATTGPAKTAATAPSKAVAAAPGHAPAAARVNNAPYSTAALPSAGLARPAAASPNNSRTPVAAGKSTATGATKPPVVGVGARQQTIPATAPHPVASSNPYQPKPYSAAAPPANQKTSSTTATSSIGSGASSSSSSSSSVAASGGGTGAWGRFEDQFLKSSRKLDDLKRRVQDIIDGAEKKTF